MSVTSADALDTPVTAKTTATGSSKDLKLIWAAAWVMLERAPTLRT
jgi:hypothetical protein